MENHLTRRLRESAVAYGGKDCHIGVREVDFRNAIREAGVPLTESDTRRIFEHFEVRTASHTLPKNWFKKVMQIFDKATPVNSHSAIP